MTGFVATLRFDGAPMAPPTRVGPLGFAQHGPLWVVAEARIDNREELSVPLRGRGLLTQGEPVDDATLLLAGYRAWGAELPTHLLGDFAFLVWDGAERRAVAARDVFGVRPLVYHRRGGQLVIGSTVGAVVAALGERPPLHHEFLRDHLARRKQRWVHETPYEGVLRVPPAHVLVADPRGERLVRHWVLGAAGNAPNVTADEAPEVLRHLLADATRRRLAAVARPGILLSGGLDSSAVAVTAEQLAAIGEAPAARLYNLGFDATPAAEEDAYVRAVAASCPHLPLTRIPADDCWALAEFGSEGGFPLDEPEADVCRALVARGVRQMVADGVTGVVTGHWGDQTLGSDAYVTLTALRDVPRRRHAEELPHFRRLGVHADWMVNTFAWAHPWIPPRLQRSLGQLRERWWGRPWPPAGGVRDWLPPPPLASFSAGLIYRHVTSGLTAEVLTALDKLGRALGVSWSFPFLDRRIVELMLALPAEARFFRGENKLVLRRALSGMLPDLVRHRRGGGLFDELIVRGLREKERDKAKRLFDSALAVEIRLMPERRLRVIFNRYFEKTRPAISHRTVSSFLCVEAWLRQLDPAPVGLTRGSQRRRNR